MTNQGFSGIKKKKNMQIEISGPSSPTYLARAAVTLGTLAGTAVAKKIVRLSEENKK